MTDTAATLFAPAHYRSDDPRTIIQAFPLANLVTVTTAGIFATATPIYFADDSTDTELIGHLARRNSQAATIEHGADVLVTFTSPNAYVSPNWYREKPEVPTWHYLSAQVRGTLIPVDDDAGQLATLRRIAEVEEAGSAAPWTLDRAEPGRVEKLLPLIRSFRIRINSIEGIVRLGQTHPLPDRLNVAKQLLDSPRIGAASIGRLMIDDLAAG